MSAAKLTYSMEVRECVVRIRESGATALGGLYDLTAVRLVRFSKAICRNQHDAEDAVSATLLKVASDPELILKADNPWAYLLCMVRNESLVVLRKRKRWTITSGLFDLLLASPENRLEKQESENQVTHALYQLPQEQTEVVVLKIWEELTFVEISAVLEIPVQTAASRYRYAISKLALLLDHESQKVNS